MNDITKIPTYELIKDYYESKADARLCDIAGPDYKDRADTNRKIMEVIRKEMAQRGELL